MYHGNILSTGNEIVDSIGTIEITGNIICNNWYNWILRENGKPHHLAISILAEIVYWYKPTEIRDEMTGRTIGFKKKFRDDLLQKSYDQLGDKFGEEKQTIKRALDCLENIGVIRRSFRTTKNENNRNLNNVMYIELVPECLQRISYENKEGKSSTPVDKYDDTLPSNLMGCNQICRETPEKTDETNTKITTKNTTKNSNTTTKENIVVDDITRSVFAPLNCNLSDTDIKAILHAAKGELSLCRDAVNYINGYSESIGNVVGFIISFIKKGGYMTVSQTHKNTSSSSEYKQHNYNMPYLEWLNEHSDEDTKTWIRSAEELLGYSLSETQRNNMPEIHRLIEAKFKTKSELKIAI